MLHGKGVAKDETGAAKMLKGAAEQDHAEAMCMLASLYSDGLAGFKENKQDALALYTTAAGLGSDEAKYKKLVLEDLVARETELEALQKKIGKINDGFIQLQLERAANEEVTHAYKGAGFFLSNMKSETPARARIEQAKRAEQEIQKLRHQVVEKEQKTQSFAQQVDAGKHEVQELLERIAILEQASDGAAGRMEALNSKCKQLEASENQLKNQVKDLLAENTELRAVADWAKNQRVEALKQALSSVVKTTISEQNEREKMLRTELQNIRKQLAQATAAAALADGGKKVALPEETPDDSGAFLKRVRRDMLMQEILLKEILTGMRHEGDYYEHVEFLKEAVSVADQGEKLFQGACEEILDRVDAGTEELTDDETINLREALKRILKSIEDKRRPESSSRLNTATQKAATELDDIRNNVARISDIMIDMMSSPGPPSEGQKKEINMLQQGISEVAAKFAGHRDEVHEHVEAGKVDKRYLDEHPALDKDIAALHKNLQLLVEGKPLSAEVKAEMLKIQQTNQTPAASRIGTAGSRSKGQKDVGGQFRPPSASRATMTEAGRCGSRSPTGAKGLHSQHGKDIASSPVNFGSPHAVDSSVTLQVIHDSIAKLADQAGGQSAERLDEAFKHVNKRLDKVLGAVRGDYTPSSSRPITPVHGWVVGEDGERRFTRAGTKGSDAGSQVDESEFLKHSTTPGLRWVEVGTEQPAGGTELSHDGLAEALQHRDEFTVEDLQDMEVTGLTFDHWIKVRDKFFKPAPEARAPGRRTRHSTRRDEHRGDHSRAEHAGQGGAALADERIARARAEMDLQLAEYKSKIEILESEKRQVEFEKNALEAELRLANNEVKRTNMELDANKKNLEQQIAFEKAMVSFRVVHLCL
jgi:predicted  nucleic acid-binding Zn-ribbon protein